jgi:hypothetical protein
VKNISPQAHDFSRYLAYPFSDDNTQGTSFFPNDPPGRIRPEIPLLTHLAMPEKIQNRFAGFLRKTTSALSHSGVAELLRAKCFLSPRLFAIILPPVAGLAPGVFYGLAAAWSRKERSRCGRWLFGSMI